MNLSLVKELLQRDDLNHLLKQILNNGQRNLITIHHATEKIHHVLKRVKKDGEHHRWDTLFGWSPTETEILNQMLQPTVVLLTLVILSLLLNICLYARVWKIARQVT